jgi:hypothetical protein
MKFTFTTYIPVLALLFPLSLKAQQQEIKPQTGTVKLLGTVTFQEAETSYQPSILTITEAPKPGKQNNYIQLKTMLDTRRQNQQQKPANNIIRKSGLAINPTVSTNFLGNPTNGTPNDNDMAISDSGLIVSVLNSNMRVFNETGKIIKNYTLAILGNIPSGLSSSFDPRVVYDPDADRFIVVFLNGRDEKSEAYICVSKTNDPTKDWYAYTLPGSNLFQDSTWSDYPIISLTKDDLFLTLNMLKNNGGWRDGFLESMIWQIDKNSGYNGDTALKLNKWNGIKYGNRNIWNICPAQGGMRPAGPNAYFVSVRPTDFQNDSIFLHEITNSVKSGTATLNTTLIKANRKYGFPPNAPQMGGQQWLSTNDGRVLTAMVQNGIVQFAGNCVDTNHYTSGIFHGRIKIGETTATLNIISSDTVDYGYPDIAYAGIGEPWDNSAMLTFSRVSRSVGAGTAVMYIDRNFNYSDEIVTRYGNGIINVLTDTLERWGDYTGIQRKYNEDRTFWLSGSVAMTPGHGTIIAKITNPDAALSNTQVQKQNIETIIFPNPAAEWFNIEFDLPSRSDLSFNLYDVNGKLVSKLAEERVKAGINRFTFSTLPLATGVYFLGIVNGTQTIVHEKIIVSR